MLRSAPCDIRVADFAEPQTLELLALHLAGMRENSPPESVFALDLSGLRSPDVTVWTAWRGLRIAGIGALKALEDNTAEVKSMRTHPAHLRNGVAAQMLAHIIAVARMRGYTRLSLETGRGEAFEPALNLYRRRGFVEGKAFSGYPENKFSQFFHLKL